MMSTSTSLTKDTLPGEQSRAFRLLVVYRWISLLPPLLWLVQRSLGTTAGDWWPVGLAVCMNLLLTLGAGPINRLLLRQPALLAVDLVLSAVLVGTTGAETSPFYLYSLAPILAAAFFFQIKGGLMAALGYALLYMAMLAWSPRPLEPAVNGPLAVAQVISFVLIALIFGYPSQLLQQLRLAHSRVAASNAEMAQRNRDLHLLDELTLVMQSSVDLAEIQETILRGLVVEMGYRSAAIGLYDVDQNTLTSWLTLENLPVPAGPQRLSHTEILSLEEDDGPLARALASRRPIEVVDGEPPTASRVLGKRLIAGRHYIALPMHLRDNTLGVILVDHLPAGRPLAAGDRASLERLAAHAGVTLGSMRLCINRAQREAVMQERTRIAADLHDSISQVLYGLAYGLDACIQLLPVHPERVQDELRKLQPVVADAQAQMRSAIFDMRSDEIASDTFVARLHRHLHAACPTGGHALSIELPGEFDQWDADLRHQLYRIAQEAMTNAAKHANAHRIDVTVEPDGDHVEVRVEDDGQGFDPAAFDSSQTLGLHSMQERVQHLGGVLDIRSSAEAGTVLLARIPLRPIPGPVIA
jgi:signal transduction histidine kinase